MSGRFGRVALGLLLVGVMSVSGCGGTGSGGPGSGGSGSGGPGPGGATTGSQPGPGETSTAGETPTGPLPAPLPTGMAGVRLTADLTSGDGRLVAEYRVDNSSDHPVVVVDRIPESLGSAALGETDPDHAWVVMAGDVVRVTKQSFPIAPGVRFVAAPVIGAHVVAPGAGVSGSARVPLPARLDVPGREFEAPREPVDPAATRWQFCVQVAELDHPSEVVTVSAVAGAPLLCSATEPLPGADARPTGR
ncbi:hypothetical protein [Intrasporangium sp.]|uniref:hypothetical protein n=1 Tax=Intrasporangium sp. TaxID=1925024 RepID=UPI0032216016